MKREWRAFGLGLGIGLFVFLTAFGLLAVDYQGRKMSFGDSTPIAQIQRGAGQAQLTVKAFGQEKTWDVTSLDEALQFLRDFACLPGNVTLHPMSRGRAKRRATLVGNLPALWTRSVSGCRGYPLAGGWYRLVSH